MMRPSPETAIGAVVVREMDDLTRLLAMRRYELGLSQTDFDTAAGWADGYSAKVEAGYRTYGKASLPIALQALGVRLEVRLVPDPAIKVVEPLHGDMPNRPRGPRGPRRRSGSPLPAASSSRAPEHV